MLLDAFFNKFVQFDFGDVHRSRVQVASHMPSTVELANTHHWSFVAPMMKSHRMPPIARGLENLLPTHESASMPIFSEQRRRPDGVQAGGRVQNLR
jgi:hypothetical protein